MKIAWASYPGRWSKAHISAGTSAVRRYETLCGLRVPLDAFDINYDEETSDLDPCKKCREMVERRSGNETT